MVLKFFTKQKHNLSTFNHANHKKDPRSLEISKLSSFDWASHNHSSLLCLVEKNKIKKRKSKFSNGLPQIRIAFYFPMKEVCCGMESGFSWKMALSIVHASDAERHIIIISFTRCYNYFFF